MIRNSDGRVSRRDGLGMGTPVNLLPKQVDGGARGGHVLSQSHFAPTLGLPRSKEAIAMKNTSPTHSGRHFRQIPAPPNVPDRVLQAIAMPTIDHRGPEFAALGQEIVAGMKRGVQTRDTGVVYPSSGTGAWEAALSNTLSPGDHVIMFETGHFATLWRQMASRLGLEVDFVPGD